MDDRQTNGARQSVSLCVSNFNHPPCITFARCLICGWRMFGYARHYRRSARKARPGSDSGSGSGSGSCSGGPVFTSRSGPAVKPGFTPLFLRMCLDYSHYRLWRDPSCRVTGHGFIAFFASAHNVNQCNHAAACHRLVQPRLGSRCAKTPLKLVAWRVQPCKTPSRRPKHATSVPRVFNIATRIQKPASQKPRPAPHRICDKAAHHHRHTRT
jgi:hypothetical protein